MIVSFTQSLRPFVHFCVGGMFLLLLPGCEQIFEPLEEEEHIMAVSATFSPLVDVANPDIGFIVFLTPVVPFSEGPNADFLADAQVELIAGNQSLGPFVVGTIGTRNVYASFVKPEIGKTYTIKIIDPIYGKAEATDRLPAMIEGAIDGVADLVTTDLPEGKKRVVFNLDMHAQDRPFEDNFYHIFVEYRLKSDPGFRRFFQVSNAENNDPSLTPYLLNQSILMDGQMFDGQKKQLKLTCQEDLEPGQEIKNVQVEIRHVSANYYEYHRTQAIQVSNGGSPVAEPTPLFSNVKGGVGFFGGFNPTRDTIQLN
ncbi:MAG: DUF4249 domain-containing protein [Saprospiraceae bacterium]|nr:DUF4249 domain-containing protein [Saprospiraceae bacterium]